MAKVWTALAAAAVVAQGHGEVPRFKCDNWTPSYPHNGHYNTSATISTEKLNVHLIPHTHDDPGWLITVDQYFTQEVDYILDTVVTELQKDPKRRFMYVEQSFFQRWWREQSKETKKVVKKLVKNGQLDLSANGGWVMHDEATPHYTTMLDQTAFGHKFLLDEFGVRPRIGWQIDPFGHSSTQGSLLSSGVGFDALYFARMDYQDYGKRKDEKNLEFLWKPSASRNDSVFTGMLQDGYGGPGGFYFENDAPIKDDPYLHDNNVCERIKTFVDQSLERAKHTKGNHIFWPMGTDFQYQNALRWFKNLDKLIHYANQEGRVNMFYSTLAAYTDLKLQDKSIQWSVKTDDFFPYADQPNGYWSGYFSSRPALKRYVRVANSVLQSVRQLEVWAGASASRVHHLAATVGLSLHHDGISGTEKQKVSDDYAQRLGEGVGNGNWRVNDLLAAPVDFCFMANVSICHRSASADLFTFLVYNPLAVAHTYTIELPLTASNAAVKLANGTAVASVVVPFTPVYAHPIQHAAPNQLVVQANVPPLSWLVYHVTPTSTGANAIESWAVVRDAIVAADNEFVHVEVDTATGSLVSLTEKRSNSTVAVKSSLLYYQAYGKPGDSCSSGAYLFHPNTSAVHALPAITSHKCYRTRLVASCAFRFGAWGALEYKLHVWDKSIVVEWTVGPIPIDDGQGKEVILRFDTSVQSEKTWYTDSNGLEFVKRVAANYVPITIATYLRDASTQFNVVTDRAQGVASLNDVGSVEIMVHRRLLQDDNKGVDEHLNETETLSLANNQQLTQGLTVRGSFALSVGPLDAAMAQLRAEMSRRYLNPLVALTAHNTSLTPPTTAWTPRLPFNVGLISLEVVDAHTIRLRLTHLFAIREHPVWSHDATVDLTVLLGSPWSTAHHLRVTELSLSGNRVLRSIPRTTVTLKAMHVRAFEITTMQGPAASIFDPTVTNLADGGGDNEASLDF
ncbi:hypothetical protein H310_01796 [Aphanomyces invadans]|uniref:Alpha-mannosidase n=1 Tax=Aphanomyces invadans TaxID=157072 RepID=A0A024UMW7_9STRA|nr:hypothetical protein H310_01796 [Aphanomyces invadans]ETW07207.1 hypothetical protein H310_01796 [Aphanomyces invadans]|eukprot:XP_008863300.1 hypothetical protein H310_01796 [Aphanomyces invadans]